jgi:uncharacterized lipoprotein NlpE involved in copper resistance
MFKIRETKWMIPAGAAAILALMGCHAQPDEQYLHNWQYFEGPGEIKPGPGLISGESGKFTIYSSEKSGLFPKEGEAKAAQTSSQQTAQTTAAAGTAAAAAAGSQAASQSGQTPDKTQQFQEFQEF